MTAKPKHADEVDKKWSDVMTKLCDEGFPAEGKVRILQGVKDEDITGEMLASCARALMHRAMPLDLKGIDVCGTGGDKSKSNVKTFNISTAVAFVVAAAGVSVIKHGNRAVSGVSGSSDVLAALKIPVATNAAMAKIQHQKHNLCFVSAPAFHPSLASLAPVRKALGRPTFLNLLGPLCNPARTARQVMGVYGFQPQVADAGKRLGRQDMMVVHSLDGLDEISLSDLTQIFHVKDGKLTETLVCPEDAGLETQPLEKLQGGSAEQNGAIIHSVFSGTTGAPHDVICLNAAAAFVTAGKDPDLKAGVERAKQVIRDGLALKKILAMKGAA
ncbi:MAG TPA: anthranilate phosphoribosyltransferase [Patescibacteria group bacterium]|nr:anthranilate phosphoribosyltransferase [Patescibacteria group bacterium]